jgi:hypothetical protein
MLQPKLALKGILAVGLWLVTIALGIADIYYIRELYFALYARRSFDAAPALLWGDILVVVAAIVFVGFILWSSEYHRRRYGRLESWKLFAWTLGVELLIPLLAMLLA